MKILFLVFVILISGFAGGQMEFELFESELLKSNPVNEITFVKRENGKVKSIQVYFGESETQKEETQKEETQKEETQKEETQKEETQKEETQKERHTKWAESIKVEGVSDVFLFVITPKNFDRKINFIVELIKHLELEDEDGLVSGIIPVKGGQITLNGKVWILGEKPHLKGE